MLCGRGNAIVAAGVSPFVITVSGEAIFHVVANGNTARAGVRVNSDGTIDKREGTTFTQIDVGTDWRIPNGSGAGTHVRFRKGGLDPTPTGGVALDTWFELNANREVYYEESTDDTEEQGTIIVDISTDGGSSTEDSGNFLSTATVGLPL